MERIQEAKLDSRNFMVEISGSKVIMKISKSIRSFADTKKFI
jgi:hypothetical protein